MLDPEIRLLTATFPFDTPVYEVLTVIGDYVILVFIICILPIFNSIISGVDGHISYIFYSVGCLGVLVASVAAPYYPFAIKFFNPELRYSGIALGWNLGNAFFGGTAPVISTFLVMQFGNFAPAYYLIFVAFLFITVSFLNRRFLANL